MAEVTNSLVLSSNVLNVKLAGAEPALNVYYNTAGSRKPAVVLAVDQSPLPALGASAILVDSTPVDGVSGLRTPPERVRSNTFEPNATSPTGYQTWWESFHILPREFAFGNLLASQSAPIEVYSAFRREDQNWTAFTNNAGAGVVIGGQPSFPHVFRPQSSGGLTLELQVSTSGQPTVDATLDFVFNTVPQTIAVPITLKRVVLFSIQPEMPYTERLQWLTEVQSHVDGTEMRVSARKNPRQFFEWDFFLEDDGMERSFFHNVMFDWQSRVFGLPLWKELTRTTSAVTAGDTTIIVQRTAYADYRVGGLFLIFNGRGSFDVLDISSVTATSVVATSGTNNSYPTGTFVMPLRVGVAKSNVSGSRYVSADAKMKIIFRVTDNDADLADLSAWNSYNSKLLIDGCNSVRGATAEQFLNSFIEFENATGLTYQASPWANSKRLTQLALLAKGDQGLWEARQMLHAIRGRQTSFYAATFSNDFLVDGDVTAGDILNVKNVGYTQFVNSRQPWDTIRIEYNNGDADDIRTITSSAESSATSEALTLNAAVAAHTIAEIKKISFVEKVRFDSDTVSIRHEVGETTTRITAPVKTVFD